MKTMRNAIVCALVCTTLSACFSDEGNYTYESLKPPTWLINVNNDPIYVYGRGGEKTYIDASRYFNWGKLDSLERSKEAVSYTHLTLPTILRSCRSRWSPYH